MKALSLTQPWASLVADGDKGIETRSWRPPESAIGKRIAIHAAKSVDDSACRKFGCDPLTIERGAVIATAFLDSWFRFTPESTEHISDEERAAGDFSDGRFGWRLTDVERLPNPVPAKGRLGLWQWDE
jgi:activating signal cointegrator 1